MTRAPGPRRRRATSCSSPSHTSRSAGPRARIPSKKLYNPEQNDDPDSWRKFTDKFVSAVHSLTVADVEGKTLTIRQLSADGKELDRFTVTK